MNRLPALAGALALLCAPAQSAAQTYTTTRAERQVIAKVVYHRKMTWRFQDRAHRKRSVTFHRERHAELPALRRLAHYWEHRHYVAWRGWTRSRTVSLTSNAVPDRTTPSGLPPHYSAWLCIHAGEGSWTDPYAPYYGGLQMDWSFMSSYGGALLASKGTADHWTPLEQMWVAERAYSSGRGFYPWPNTARACGLI